MVFHHCVKLQTLHLKTAKDSHWMKMILWGTRPSLLFPVFVSYEKGKCHKNSTRIDVTAMLWLQPSNSPSFHPCGRGCDPEGLTGGFMAASLLRHFSHHTGWVSSGIHTPTVPSTMMALDSLLTEPSIWVRLPVHLIQPSAAKAGKDEKRSMYTLIVMRYNINFTKWKDSKLRLKMTKYPVYSKLGPTTT